jgi:hypothetical protein
MISFEFEERDLVNIRDSIILSIIIMIISFLMFKQFSVSSNFYEIIGVSFFIAFISFPIIHAFCKIEYKLKNI